VCARAEIVLTVRQKLGVTVKDIIQSTPYMPPGADMVYNGAKNTTTYAIDARTGVIQRVFSTGGLSGVVNDRKCKTTTRLSELDDECDSTEDGANKIIMLGRTGMNMFGRLCLSF
jgi:serine/threonine-protein kinase/endoribonuclease IRE1